MSQHQEKVQIDLEIFSDTCQLFLQVKTINTQKSMAAENVLAGYIKLKALKSIS